MANLPSVTDATWTQEVEQHDGVVVVDFNAAWCGPCRMIAPVVEKLAEEYAGKAKVVQIDADANPQTLVRFNVRSIPTLLYFKGGQVVERITGAVPRPVIEQ